MRQIAQALIFDRDGRLVIYLRDNKPDIPFPEHWDFFGGHLEDGETPEVALVREVEEELGATLTEWKHFRSYVCTEGDAYPNVKHIYRSRIPQGAGEMLLREGQRLAGIAPEERTQFSFANILGRILEDFIAAGLWPKIDDHS